MTITKKEIMIGWMQGVLLNKTPPTILLNVHGVGYEIETSMNSFCVLPEIGQSLELFTHFVVREDAHRLFGFSSASERALFRRLIKINGVGPKVALAILSSMTPDDFCSAVMQQDVSSLTRVPGIGKKTAERLLVEIKDSLDEWGQDAGSPVTKPHAMSSTQEAIDGLIALGYKPQEASKLIRKIEGEGMTSGDLIKAALQGVGVA